MQSAILWFATDEHVDTAEDREDRINEDIGGAALARWLSAALQGAGLPATEPWAEDHGWDFEVKQAQSVYLIVCTIEDRNMTPRQASVQVHLTKPKTSKPAALDRHDAVVSKISELIEARGARIDIE
jgi:predicted XRE-type DNA-binding protein